MPRSILKKILNYRTGDGDFVKLWYVCNASLRAEFNPNLTEDAGTLDVIENNYALSNHQFYGSFTDEHQFMLLEALDEQVREKVAASELDSYLDHILPLLYPTQTIHPDLRD